MGGTGVLEELGSVLGFYCPKCGFEYAVTGRFWRMEYYKDNEHQTPCLRCDGEMVFTCVSKRLMCVREWED